MLYKGQLGKHEFYVERLAAEQLAEIEMLQQMVCDALEDKTILQPLSKEELLYILNGNGIMIGAFADSQLIAVRALLEPDVEEKEHLGLDVGAKNLARVLYQEISFIHPKFRGYGLQQTLATIVMTQVDMAKYDWVCATVKPYNIASLKDKLVQNIYIRALKYKYGGKLRYVMAKPLHKEQSFTGGELVIAMGDVEAQQQALRDGYIGIAIEKRGEEWFVQFGRLKDTVRSQRREIRS
ncbi:GNAT family N-acetyltransferase [Metasolibacillus sp. FSL K6-0083]|uniref:GNAT family N-acetyltransferase n=1 Tax=Metasolibacillus sp. FSL K6-0083 TaxID=2921416 RepID=UPI003159D784